MHLEKPSLAKRIQDPTQLRYDVLKKIFFTSSPASQASGEAFIGRLSQRKDDLDPVSGPKVAGAQMAAFREWGEFKGQRFAELMAIRHPTLVVNGVHDEMIPVSYSDRLSENLANAVLLMYPDAGHGALFQYHESFTRQASAFLASDSQFAPDQETASSRDLYDRMNPWHRKTSGLQCGDDDLPSAGLLHPVEHLRIFPGVDPRAVDRLLIGKDVPAVIQQEAAAVFHNRGEQGQHAERFGRFRESQVAVALEGVGVT